jgi:hypothetical protein
MSRALIALVLLVLFTGVKANTWSERSLCELWAGAQCAATSCLPDAKERCQAAAHQCEQTDRKLVVDGARAQKKSDCARALLLSTCGGATPAECEDLMAAAPRESSRPAPTPAPGAQTQPARPPAQPTTTRQSATQPQPAPAPPRQPPPPARVTFSVKVSPASSRLTLDQKPLKGNPFRGSYAVDDQQHELRVTAPGYVTLVRQVSFAADVALNEQLEREAPKGKPTPQQGRADDIDYFPPPNEEKKPEKRAMETDINF